MNNKIYNIGDTLIITVKPKQKGTAIITSFEDKLTGLTEQRKVRREYRITEDDVFYTEWQELSNDAIRGKKLKQNNNIQVRYTREGSDKTEYIEFESIRFNGDFNPEIINSPILDGSIFSGVAWSEETEALAKNLFKKLYFRGIIPTYIKRGDNLDIEEDRDFVDLFYSIAKYFAIIIQFFKRFENFYNDEELMREWIRTNEIQFDESTVTLSQLQYLSRHLYDEIRKRGTKIVFKRQGETENGQEVEIDGEFIRLIQSKKNDELLYEYMPLRNLGWCLGNSSPLYRGTSFAEKLNKTREDGKDFISLENFQTFSQGYLTELYIDTISDETEKDVLVFQVRQNGVCGLGRIDEDTDVSNKIYVADPNLDYEITFMLNPYKIGSGTKLSFGVEAFNATKTKLDNAFISSDGQRITEMFLDKQDLSVFLRGEWYFIRGVIHAYSSTATENVALNCGFGNNLTFNNRFIKYILPKIYLSTTSDSKMFLWDYKIRPLIRGTNILLLKNGRENSHSVGFIQSPQIFYAYFKNNNNNKSKADITDIIERYLLPYNVTDILQFIDSE